ncbi:MAG: DUF4258 domain-containing protein [Acidobacteriota bacterium]|nr:DUF4258 domain-containing protein [Acidobacteriota bacterium]
MARRILERIRELIRAGEYGLTIHALEELEHDGLAGEDLERILLSGRIVERQRDADTGHYKYLVLGQCRSETPAYAVVKFADPKRVLVLTVFLA